MSTYFKTFAARTIYHSPQMVVRQNRWYRWLMFQDRENIQTLINRRKPHQAAMPYLYPFSLALRTSPGPTCLLGLGGGAVVHMLGPQLQQYPITAVETSAEVISVGSEYFMLHTIPALSIVQEEAYSFLANTDDLYQHILVDIYADTGFPDKCAEPDFFRVCKQHLHANGFLALNLVQIQVELPILQNLRKVFDLATVCIPVPPSSNMIVIASPSKSLLQTWIQNHPQLLTLIWDPLWGLVAKISQ